MAGSEASDYGGSWYASRMVETPPRGRLSLELDVDVCVIGGGLAGLTVALEVAKRGWSVAVLEARRVAWNASGRNAGFVLPGFPADPQELIDKVGPAHARTLWAMSEAGADYVRRTIRETQMAGAELDESGWLHVSRTGADAKLAASADFLGREFGTAAEFWPAERVRAHLRSTRYFGGLYLPGAFSHQPAQLRARPCRRGRGRGCAHLRGDAGARDRSRGRAQAHHDALGSGARGRTWCSPATCTSAT